MKKKLYIICSTQFGYLIDTYQYCIHLSEKYDLIYVCINEGKQLIDSGNTTVCYLNTSSKGLKKWLEFVLFCKRRIIYCEALIFIKYFTLCSLLKVLLPNKRVTLDIRTGSINKSKLRRTLWNLTLRIEALFFKRITIISSSLASKLFIKKHKILPLGCPTLITSDKSFETIKMLYVGTLSNRDIHKTILGLHSFVTKLKDNALISYHIIGDGYHNEVSELKQLVRELKLERMVFVHGRKSHEDVIPYLEECNLGVSFIPMTSYYDVQPVTKTIEYFASGMPVIGTSTKEQLKIINSSNGIICNDSPISFEKGLQEFFRLRNSFDSKYIKSSVARFSWENICREMSSNILDRY